jgi:hypothetical protein
MQQVGELVYSIDEKKCPRVKAFLGRVNSSMTEELADEWNQIRSGK